MLETFKKPGTRSKSKQVIPPPLEAFQGSTPGPVLHDLNVFLDFIGTEGKPVSAAQGILNQKSVVMINDQFSCSIAIGSRRVLMTQHPYLMVLSVLAQTVGLARIVRAKGRPHLTLNPDGYEAWNLLNPTEQYFSLLEYWFYHAKSQFLEALGPDTPAGHGTQMMWTGIMRKSEIQVSYQFKMNSTLNFIAMLDLFGFLEIHNRMDFAQKPVLENIVPLPWGLWFMNQIDEEHLLFAELPTFDPPSLGHLQPIMGQWFPQWKRSYTPPKQSDLAGVGIFRVSMEPKVWRRIAIDLNSTFADLADGILNSFDFDHDHLYEFPIVGSSGSIVKVNHYYLEEPPLANITRLNQAPLYCGMNFQFVYDFGADWRFEVCFESLASEKDLQLIPRTKRQDKKDALPVVIEKSGPSPEQYEGSPDEDF